MAISRGSQATGAPGKKFGNKSCQGIEGSVVFSIVPLGPPKSGCSMSFQGRPTASTAANYSAVANCVASLAAAPVLA